MVLFPASGLGFPDHYPCWVIALPAFGNYKHAMVNRAIVLRANVAQSDLADILNEKLQQAGHLPAGSSWERLRGGQTNRVWRVTGSGTDIVCKLFGNADQNPMFPNLPKAEYACLAALEGRALAPKVHAKIETELGTVLLYEHLDGPIWTRGAPAVAKMLGAVHQGRAPEGLRSLPFGGEEILDHGQGILARCESEPALALGKCRPPAGPSTQAPLCLVHSDVVPANIIVTSTGPRLIDWQCPGIGDPVEDIAGFLSQGMHRLYRQEPLMKAERESFLAAYPDAKTVERFLKLEKLYQWRMAAYCLLRSEQGREGYRDAFLAECAAAGFKAVAPDRYPIQPKRLP